CMQFVNADDFSLAEHQDYHVAMELQRDITAEVLTPRRRGKGVVPVGKGKGKSGGGGQRKKAKVERVCRGFF
ncbi:hypothetical protein HDU98_005479, partial [Podochytrium sp. JEL0797]